MPFDTCPTCGYLSKPGQPEPPPALKTSNAPVSQMDVAIIQPSMAQLQERSRILDEQIVAVEKLLDELREEQTALNTMIDFHKATLSPIRLLPDEILSEIFVIATGAQMWNPFNQDEMPWTLSKVCRRWREVTTETYSLWNRLHITIYDSPTARADLLQECLHHSRSTPLTLRIDCFSSKITESLVAQLVSECHRWKNLEIRFESNEIHDILKQAKGNLPQLEYLAWKGVHWTDAFSLAPRLKQFKTTRIATQIPFPSSQLNDVEIDGWGVFPATILQGSPQLIKCSIIRCNHGDEGFRPDETIQLPLLRQLRCSYPNLLPYFHLPALKELEIIHPHPNELFSFIKVTTLLNNSHCELQSFTISSSSRSGNVDHFLDMLRAMPSLLYLDLSAIGIGYQAIMPHLRHSENMLLPRLRELTLRISNPAVLHSWLDMIEDRRVSNSSDIQVLHVDIKRIEEKDPKVYQRLMRLQTAGLDIRQTSPLPVAAPWFGGAS